MTGSPLIGHNGSLSGPIETGHVHNSQSINKENLKTSISWWAPNQDYMQNFREIGEVTWPALVRFVWSVTLNVLNTIS